MARALRECIEEVGESLCTGDVEFLFASELPRQRVYVERYGIDRHEVTRRPYRRCVLAGRCAPPSGPTSDRRVAHPQHPVTGVTARDAERYCAFAGGRLPTEAEWERAARRPQRRRYPWSDAYNPRVENHGARFYPDPQDGFGYAAPVGSYPGAASPYGLLDMGGNVREWTADGFDPEAYRTTDRMRPHVSPDVGFRVVRGGSWRTPGTFARGARRDVVAADRALVDVGFRCAHDPLRPE